MARVSASPAKLPTGGQDLDRGSDKRRRKGFAEADYARLLDGAHQELAGPIVLVRDNLPAHTSRAVRQLIAARSWLTVFQLRRTRLS